MSEFKLSWEHLNNSQLDLAINHLPSDKNLSRSELREKHHIISKVMIFKGLFSQALLKIHWSISQYGENISLEFDRKQVAISIKKTM